VAAFFALALVRYMGSAGRADFTSILIRASQGDDSAVNQLLPLVYDELRALAESYLQRERPSITLQATALVHEAYLRLVNQEQAQWQSRAHFFAIAAQAIRRILVDHARAHRSRKRGGDWQRVRLGDDLAAATGRGIDLLALDSALEKLARLDPRQARIIELRFFGGLSLRDVADVLGVSPRTVDGDWNMARAWLRHELADGAEK
jgi:RNA polymerase sigma factor (TIGR02999 family)